MTSSLVEIEIYTTISILAGFEYMEMYIETKLMAATKSIRCALIYPP